MTDLAPTAPYGTLVEPATLRLERLLPGPIERVWAYLTDSDLRRQWLAAGEMELAPGAAFELVWRNGELSDTQEPRPEGFSAEHRLQSRILAVDPPHRLAFTWGTSEVAFTLAPHGDDVLLTVVHSRVPDRAMLLNVSAGWHAHLDVLSARAAGQPVSAFWSRWVALKAEYTRRLPG
jgi:uncharacterized protein YndB with AHSA1/START domain